LGENPGYRRRFGRFSLVFPQKTIFFKKILEKTLLFLFVYSIFDLDLCFPELNPGLSLKGVECRTIPIKCFSSCFCNPIGNFFHLPIFLFKETESSPFQAPFESLVPNGNLVYETPFNPRDFRERLGKKRQKPVFPLKSTVAFPIKWFWESFRSYV
jgi:hypothetical protein